MKKVKFTVGLTRVRTSTLVVAALVALSLSACDSAVDPVETSAESDEMVEMLSAELSLSTAEAQEIAAVVDSNETDRRARVPGWSWRIAARLQQALTEEQKARLIALTERIEERDVFGLVCFVGPGGLTGPDWHNRPVFSNRLQVIRLISDLLTDDQIAEIRALLARQHEAVKALVRQAKAGEISREELANSLRELHAQTVAAVYDVLTEEQIAAVEEAISDRKEAFEAIVAATKRAMYEALDATDVQIGKIESLCDRLTEEKDALFQMFDDGAISREELKTSLNALNEIEKEQLMVVLSDTQFEIVQIHKAVLLRWRRIEMHLHRRGGNGRFNEGDGGNIFGNRTDANHDVG